MAHPTETTLLKPRNNHYSNTVSPITSRSPSPFMLEGGGNGEVQPLYVKPDIHGAPRPVDVNVMKRNMTIAKGFMDISLLMANANQLRNLLHSGDPSKSVYYIILVGLLLSLILQVVTGFMLIIKERFDLNLEEDHESAELYNNITVMLVFVTLLLNVFIASFGIEYMKPKKHPFDQGILNDVIPGGRARSITLPFNGTIPSDVETFTPKRSF